MACVILAGHLCGQPTHPGIFCCDPHTQQMRNWLRMLELYTAWLPTLAGPLRTGTVRRAPGFGSSPPARLDVLTALDPRSSVQVLGEDDDEQPIRSVLVALHSMCRAMREERDHTPPKQVTVASEVGYLLGAVGWTVQQPWVDEHFEELRELHQDLRRLSKDSPDGALAPCLTVTCGAPVYWTYGRDGGARCSGCGRSYAGVDLLRLRAQEAS